MRLEGGPWLTVASLVLGGREVLVGPQELPLPYRVHGERAGVTLLHPWANRLSNDDDLPHGAPRDPGGLAIHGLPAGGDGWVLDGHAATLQATWPAPHEVLVTFEPGDDALRVTTRVRAAEPVPIAFGWHPYLRPAGPRAGWELVLPPRRHLALDDRGLPTGGAEDEPSHAAPLGDRTLDDAFDRVAPGAVFAAGELEVVHDAGYPCAQVFAPGDRDLVSLEPMTAPVDALRSGAAARATEAEAVWTLRLRR